MPKLKGFVCTVDGEQWSSAVHALTASQARYQYFRHVSDCWPDIHLMDIKVRRSPVDDMILPDLPEVVQRLDKGDEHILLHTFGCTIPVEPKDWGYRNRYCADPKKQRLNRLVDLGLMTGPHGVNNKGETPGWCGAFFYLTEEGKEAALALAAVRFAKRSGG